METRYNVYFAGQLLAGQDLATVRENLAKLFNTDSATLEKLFSGKAQLLKRDCDKATALKYQQAMERAGAQPIIKSSEAEAAPRTAAPPETAAAPAATLTAAQRIAALAAAPDESSYRSDNSDTLPSGQEQSPAGAGPDVMQLAPPGADVLREDERHQPDTQEVDTAGLEIDAAAQRLSEESPPPPAAPDTSHMTLGDAGETIPNLPSDQVPLSPDTQAINLSPEGTDFSDCAAPEAQAPTLDLSDMALAPTGSDVLEEKYREREQPQAPTTDHISLEQ